MPYKKGARPPLPNSYSAHRAKPKLEKSSGKILKCTSCRDYFKNPRNLDCGHEFCISCLHESLTQLSPLTPPVPAAHYHEDQHYMPLSLPPKPTTPSAINCPACRRDTRLPEGSLENLRQDPGTVREAALARARSNLGWECGGLEPEFHVMFVDWHDITYAIYVSPVATIAELRERIGRVLYSGGEITERLLYRDKILNDGKYIDDYNIVKSGTIRIA